MLMEEVLGFCLQLGVVFLKHSQENESSSEAEDSSSSTFVSFSSFVGVSCCPTPAPEEGGCGPPFLVLGMFA